MSKPIDLLRKPALKKATDDFKMGTPQPSIWDDESRTDIQARRMQPMLPTLDSSGFTGDPGPVTATMDDVRMLEGLPDDGLLQDWNDASPHPAPSQPFMRKNGDTIVLRYPSGKTFRLE